MQTDPPFWLEEAYSAAIARQDVGIMQRNMVNCELTTAVLRLLFPGMQRALDYGGGHGILVRLMRDRGYDFSWFDRYANNDYARGFEHVQGQRYNFLSAFELLEHLPDPLADLAAVMELSDNVFVSTCTVPSPAPGLKDWWYYSPSSGQHIAFYTPASLQVIASHFNRHLLSNGSYHLFTATPKSRLRFEVATRFKSARLLNSVARRPGLIDSDYQQMIR